MKKIFLTAAVIFSVIFASFAEAANIKDHPRLAVMNFASSAAEYAICQLSASGLN